MGTNEERYVDCFYKRYQGRVAINVGYSQKMEEIFPFVLEDEQGKSLGIIAMAALLNEDITAVHIYHFSVFIQKCGNGSKMLTELCNHADSRNVVLSLSPIPSPNGRDDQIHSPQLISWYLKFGFRGDALLCRQPIISTSTN